MFTSSKRLPPSPKTRRIENGLLLRVTPPQGEGETRQAFGRAFFRGGGGSDAAEPARPGPALSGERERRERPRAGGRRGWPCGAGRRAPAELGDEPEVLVGSRRGWGRRRAAIHLGDVAAIPYSPRPLPIRPPTRPLAAGCCKAALPQPDGERQCLPAGHPPCVSPARPPLLASPAPCWRAQWRRREKAAESRRCVSHSTTRPRPRRPPPVPGAGKGGGWEAGRRGWAEGPGGKESRSPRIRAEGLR